MMDPVKVAGICNWPSPKSLTEVRSFLGFCNFYHHFIHDFSKVSQPLHALMTKDAKWQWTSKEAVTFQHLKDLICSHPVLVFPEDDCQYLVEADSSNYATGAVLSQLCDDDKWHPVAYLCLLLNTIMTFMIRKCWLLFAH